MLLRFDQVCTRFLGKMADRSVGAQKVAAFGATYLLPVFFLVAVICYPFVEKTTASWLVYLACLCVSVLMPHFVTLALSFFIRRKRPYEVMPDAWHVSLRLYTPSFPSGHATLAFAIATFLTWYWQPVFWIVIVLYSVAVVVALSRVFVSVHYVSDILVGALIGVVGSSFLSLLGHMLWTAQSV